MKCYLSLINLFLKLYMAFNKSSLIVFTFAAIPKQNKHEKVCSPVDIYSGNHFLLWLPCWCGLPDRKSVV